LTDIIEIPDGIDRFQLFYVEAIMNDSSFPQINRIRPIFQNLTIDEFIELVEKVFSSGDYELTQQFLYFLMLFRDMNHIPEYINSDKFTIDKLEKFIMFIFAYCTIHEHSTDRVLDEILFFLNRERLLDLALNSVVINNDKLILFIILTKFDIDMLNKYFANMKDKVKFINFFVRLPDEVLRSIIARNYHLFQYIMVMMGEVDTGEIKSTEFIQKYSSDIQQFSKLSDILRKYRARTDFQKEKDLPFEKRDMQRLSFLVNIVRDLPDPVKAVEYFAGEKVFMDDMEKSVVLAVVTDPMLKNIFRNYEMINSA
jgi:hypothetical protein